MFDLPLQNRLYYFANFFLWCTLSFYHYLDESVVEEEFESQYSKWSNQFENLAEWALNECDFALESTQINQSEGEYMLTRAQEFGDSLIFHWGDFLDRTATKLHDGNESVSKATWLNYLYTRIVKQILSDYGPVLQEIGALSEFYVRYQEHKALFDNIYKAIHQEFPIVSSEKGETQESVGEIQEYINDFSSKIGSEWRKAVLVAARDLDMPDFSDNIT